MILNLLVRIYGVINMDNMNPLIQLMHDTMSKLGTIETCTFLISKNGVSEDQQGMLDIIDQRRKEIQEVLDRYYEETKK